MKDMNFPDDWITAMELTYHNPTVQFFLNNKFTKEIFCKCGVLRGPMSVILYIISMQLS